MRFNFKVDNEVLLKDICVTLPFANKYKQLLAWLQFFFLREKTLQGRPPLFALLIKKV